MTLMLVGYRGHRGTGHLSGAHWLIGALIMLAFVGIALLIERLGNRPK